MSDTNKDLRDFIGDKVIYDEFGAGYFWGVQKDGGQQMIGEVRGWGAIQNLRHFKHPREAEDFQDRLGRYMAEAINEKMQRDIDSCSISYPMYISCISLGYEKLLVVQSQPQEKYYFKDKEITKELYGQILGKVTEFLMQLSIDDKPQAPSEDNQKRD